MKYLHAFLILICIPVLVGSNTQINTPANVHYPDKRQLIRLVLEGMEIWTAGSEELVFRTGAVESMYRFRLSLHNGPELGYWQIHPKTAKDILFRYLQRPSKADLKQGLESVLGYKIETLLEKPEHLESQLRDNDILGIALCRIWYGMAPYHIPRAGNLWAQALIWKRWFNTHKGNGSTRMFVRKVHRFQA